MIAFCRTGARICAAGDYVEPIKGYLFSVLASLLISLGFIFNTFALREGINPETGSLFIFIFATLGSLAMVTASGKLSGLVAAYRKYLKPMALIGFLNGLGALAWFYSLSLLGPSLLGFLLTFSTVFIVVLSIVFLKERFNYFEGFGGLITFAGALMITYSNSTITEGAVYALVSGILFAVSIVMSKAYIAHISALYMNNMRSFFMLLTIFAYTLAAGSLVMPASGALVFILLAAVSAPVLSFYLHFRSMEIADLSKITLIRSLDPLVIAVLSAFMLGETLKDTQFAGGIVIVFGIVLIGLARYRPKIIAKWVP